MLRDLLREAYGAMRHNRRRTALTMLGMAWGIATVVMLLAYGDGFGRACANIFANFGSKLVIVVPGRTSMQAGGEKAGTLVRFTQDDVETLTTNLPQISRITPEASKHASIQYDTRVFTFDVTGNDPDVFSIRALKLEQGRFYGMEDQIQRARVAVIGSEAKEKLFSGRNALGEGIRVDGLNFEVIGVLGAKMQEGNDDINRVIYVPFSTMSDLKDTHYLDSIWFTYQTPEYEQLEQSVRTIMATQHKFSQTDHQAVEVFNLMTQLHQFEIITLGLKILMGFIGTLTLGIGGVGLMNIMLVSVTQRTREIGVQKALGRASTLYPAAVPGRGTHHHFPRRGAWSGAGICGRAFGGKAHLVQRLCQERGSRRHPPDHRACNAHCLHPHSRRGRTDQRHGPGIARLPSRSNRGVAARIATGSGHCARCFVRGLFSIGVLAVGQNKCQRLVKQVRVRPLGTRIAARGEDIIQTCVAEDLPSTFEGDALQVLKVSSSQNEFQLSQFFDAASNMVAFLQPYLLVLGLAHDHPLGRSREQNVTGPDGHDA
jgi:putative ABC transport system permease protein